MRLETIDTVNAIKQHIREEIQHFDQINGYDCLQSKILFQLNIWITEFMLKKVEEEATANEA